MNFKKKIFYLFLCLISTIILMPFVSARTTGYYKPRSGTCSTYVTMPGFCVQPGVVYNRNANYGTCSINLTCYEAAAAWYGKQHEDTQTFWAAQTILNGRTFYSDSNCSNVISTTEVSQYATSYCTLPKFSSTEINLRVGDIETITDENNVLSQYTVSSNSPSIEVSKNGNQLIIKALSIYDGAEVLLYKGSRSAIVGSCSSASQNLVNVNSAPYVAKKIYVNVAEAEIPQPVIKYGSLKILKTDEDGNPIQGVKFKLGINLNGTEGSEYVIKTTDENGIITQNNIVVGSSFYYQETEVPEGYTISDPRVKYIYIGDEKTYEVKVINIVHQEKGTIKIIKTDEDGNPLEGIQFKIGQNILGRENEDYVVRTTDKYGQIIETGLDKGSYSVKETRGIEGYIFNESEAYTYTLVINDEQYYDEITIKNRKSVDTQLKIIKIAKENKSALPNVKLNVYNEDGSLYQECITDKDGTIIIDNIEYGKYFIEEVEAPTGYAKLTSTVPFEITKDEPKKIITIDNELINSKTGEINITIVFLLILLISGCTYLVLKKRQKFI